MDKKYRRIGLRGVSLLQIALFCVFAKPGLAQVIQSSGEYAEDRILVKFKNQAARQHFHKGKSLPGISRLSSFRLINAEVLKLDDLSVEEAIERVRRR